MRLIFIVLSLSLAGCQGGFANLRPAGPADPGGAAGTANSGAIRELGPLNAGANTRTNAGNSQVLRLVGAAAGGDVGVADDAKFGGRVSVQVTRDFTAASGRHCRRFIVRRLAAGAEPSHHVACLNNDQWFYVDP